MAAGPAAAVAPDTPHLRHRRRRPRPTGCIEERAEPSSASALRYPAADAAAPTATGAAAGPTPARAASGAGRASAWSARARSPAGRCCPRSGAAGLRRLGAVASASGVSARRAAERHGFAQAVVGRLPTSLETPRSTPWSSPPAHDTHAELAAAGAARPGSTCWCEKPLALSRTSWTRSRPPGRTPGGSSRSASTAAGRPPCWRPAQRCWPRPRAASCWSTGSTAGPVPDGHWYARPGGQRRPDRSARSATSWTRRRRWSARRSRRRPGCPAAARPGDDAAVSLRFADGSLATIAYGSVPPASGQGMDRGDAPASRRRGHRRLPARDGGRQGHLEGRARTRGTGPAWRRSAQAVTGGAAMPTEEMLATMTATIAAAAGASGRE